MKGKITISRPSDRLKRWINIDLEDENYNTMMNVQIDLKGFAEAITGLGSVGMEYKQYTKEVK